MKKIIVILFVMLQFGLILGAKENFSTESIKIKMYHEMKVQYGIPTSTNLGTN